MMEWKECVASEFCLKVTDGTHDSPKPKEKGHYLITSKHIGKGNIDYSTANLISDEDYQKVLKRSAVEQYDILFSMIGTIGNIYRETSPCIDYAVKNMGIFKMGGDECKSLWLYYWLQSPKAKEYIYERLAGSTQSYLTLDSLRNFPILYPHNFEEMHRIISILSSLDRKIELNNKINAQLEEMSQAIFKSWFVDFEPFKDGKFVESELGMIPEGWEVISLGNMASVTKNSINPQKTPDLLYHHYSLPAYDELKYPVIQAGVEIMSNKTGFKGKTTLISKLNPHIKRVWFVNQVKENPICSTEFIPIKANDENYCSFVHCLINSDIFYNKAVSGVNGATTSHQRIHAEDIMGLMFATNMGAMHKFCKITYPILCKIEHNIEENLRLSQLRDTLLPKLMNGEIELPNDDYLQHCLYYKGEEECPFPAGTHAAWYWRDEAMGQDENHRSIGHSFIEKGLQFIPLPAEQVQQLPSDIQDMLAYATACACNMQPMGGDEYLKHYGKSIEELNEIDKK